MPQGPFGVLRLTRFGPLSRSTEEELRSNWEPCPHSEREREICKKIKESAIKILNGQGIYADCKSLVEINSGSCHDIVEMVTDELKYVNVIRAGDGDHVWIEYDGKHYDAEVPSGVGRRTDLPFFSRIPPRTVMEFMRDAHMAGADVPYPEIVDDIYTDATDYYINDDG